MPRAAVCHAFAAPLTVEEVTLDPPGPDEVRLRVTACAICHSDVAYAAGAWGGELPAVFGHEACGIVVETGPGVAAVAEGDRVVVSLVRTCGVCARCREGAPALCAGRFRLDDVSPILLRDGRRAAQGMRCGAFADEAVVHASQAVPVPDDVPDTSACLIACAVMTGYGAAVRDAGISPGSTVVVLGAGRRRPERRAGRGHRRRGRGDRDRRVRGEARRRGRARRDPGNRRDRDRPGRRGRRAHRRRRRRGDRHGWIGRRGRPGARLPAPGRHARGGRHAAVRRAGPVRSGSARPRRQADRRQQAGLGPACRGRAPDRRALPRRAAAAGRARDRHLSARARSTRPSTPCAAARRSGT